MNEQLSFTFDEEPEKPAPPLAVFDLETTGLDLAEARIVSACAVELDSEGQTVGTMREWLANPGIEIPLAASNVHGITTQKAIEFGRDAKVVVSEIIATLENFMSRGIPVVAYNAPYDFTILHHEALRHGLNPLSDPKPIIDPLVLDKFVDQFRPGKRTLEVVAKLYGVELSEAHNASADAIAAGKVAQAIFRKYFQKLTHDFNQLHESQIHWSAKQDDSFENHIRKTKPEFTIRRGWPVKL